MLITVSSKKFQTELYAHLTYLAYTCVTYGNNRVTYRKNGNQEYFMSVRNGQKSENDPNTETGNNDCKKLYLP